MTLSAIHFKTISQGWVYSSVLEYMSLCHDALGFIPGSIKSSTSQRLRHAIALQIFHIKWNRDAHPGE